MGNSFLALILRYNQPSHAATVHHIKSS